MKGILEVYFDGEKAFEWFGSVKDLSKQAKLIKKKAEGSGEAELVSFRFSGPVAAIKKFKQIISKERKNGTS
ncbi:MAG TPA: hypothetical protein VGA67_02855 [Candidatus Dojkabacteria bacterium]